MKSKSIPAPLSISKVLPPALHHKLTTIPLGLRQAAFMFVAISLGSALSYLVHFAMSRMLGPSDYGEFASLNSFYNLIITPLGIFSVVTAHFIARFQARGELHRVGPLLIDMFKWVALIGALAAAAVALASPLLASFLQLTSTTPLLVVAITIFVGAMVPIATGALQGLQKFLTMGSVNILGAGLRLIFGILLVSIGLGVSGALAAMFLAGLFGLVLALLPLFPLFRRPAAGASTGHGLALKDLLSYAGLVLVGTTCFAALTNMDVMIVKHYFPPEAAGQYASASVLAKIILFFPAAITTVMFPKAAERHTLQQDSSGIARQATAAVAGLCGGLVVVYFLLPSFLIHLLFGAGYAAAIPLVGLFGAAMALFALVSQQMNYYLSIRKTRYFYLLVGSMLLQGVALVLFHHSLLQVVVVLLLNAGVVLVVGELVCRGLTGNLGRRLGVDKNH